jgi:hypothetical protein
MAALQTSEVRRTLVPHTEVLHEVVLDALTSEASACTLEERNNKEM